MTSTESRPPLANFAIALAAGLAMFTYAAGLVDPSAAAESHFLAVWATVTLLAIAGLATDLELGITAVLVTLVVWVVPVGPPRGAAVGLLLTMGMIAALARRLDRERDDLTWQTAVAGALGLQALCRADRLLQVELEPRIFVSMVVLPVAAAAALMVLKRHHHSRSVFLAAIAAIVLVPGFSVTVTLSLVAVALGTLWRDRVEPKWLVMTCSLATVVAGYFWQPPLAGLLAVTIICVRAAGGIKTYGGVALLAAVLILVHPPANNWSDVIRLAALGPLLLPALLVPTGKRHSYLICGGLLAVLALRTVSGADALAAPLAVAALALRSKGSAARVQHVWSIALLSGSVLLATYPWLRHHPLEDTLGLLGMSVGWLAALAVVATTWILTLLCALFEGAEPQRGVAPWIAGAAVLGLALLIALPTPGLLALENDVRVLTAEEPLVDIDLAQPTPLHTLVLDSYLENSAALPVGTEVAIIEITGSEGPPQTWKLRAGLESGEWAARRSDVVALPDFKAPAPWLSWVSPDGQLFAQRYRAVWQLTQPTEAVRIDIKRNSDLPIEVSLALFHLELRP